jgi:glucosamine--fructose-6-phosphate aminotransferase (isomerizing)
MCGIVGYVGNKPAAPILLEGLARLEYRGYDCAGIAVVDNNSNVAVSKNSGKLKELVASLNGRLPDGTSGIGHTRWATHGIANHTNAHPHLDCSKNVIIVHNGIVENYLELKDQLHQNGHTFTSDTDSEIIAHLIESILATGTDFIDAVRKTAGKLEGAQAVVAIYSQDPNHLIAFRLGNAGGITVGYGQNEMFLASDIPAILPNTRRIVSLAPGELVSVGLDETIYQSIKGDAISKIPEESQYTMVDVTKGSYQHFMLKEIMEQPEITHKAIVNHTSLNPLQITLEGLGLQNIDLRDINRVILTGMGSSLHACQVGRFLIESLSGVPAEADNASELRYRNPMMDHHTLLVSVSQSGETADTLGAMEAAASANSKQITICNVAGSQATRIANGTININAGPEIGVASTKSMIGSIVALYLLSAYMGSVRGVVDNDHLKSLIEDLSIAPALMKEALDQNTHIEQIAKKYSLYNHFLHLGRGINMPVAMEGALKLKEVSYIHAEGYAAGEMKHGPIALIDEKMPVVVIAPTDQLYYKMLGNIDEVKARGGKVIALLTQGNDTLRRKVDEAIELPASPNLLTPLIAILPLQLLAYHMAVYRGCDVDQPRNLAKTVTVE